MKRQASEAGGTGAAIQRQFGPAAARYAASAVHAGGPDLDALVAAAQLSGRERVLDVGCGAGHTALACAPQAAHVVALDLTSAMLETARTLARERGLPNVHFQRGDAACLPFDDSSFDVVTSRLCAHHYAAPARSVLEAARVLSAGGVFLLVDSVAPDDPLVDTYLNAIEVLRDPSHVRDHSVGAWRMWFREADLDFDVAGRFSMRIDFEPWIERLATPGWAAAAVGSLLDAAPDAVRDALCVRGGGDYSFSMPIALLRGRKS